MFAVDLSFLAIWLARIDDVLRFNHQLRESI
jgi:hypothetical protein